MRRRPILAPVGVAGIALAALLAVAGPAAADPGTPGPVATARPAPAATGAIGPAATPVLPALPASPDAAAGTVSPQLAAAKRAAEALQQQVDGLQAQAELAIEHYNEVHVALASAERAHAAALRRLAGALASAQDAEDLATDRIRALYMTGGAPALTSIALGAETLSQALASYHNVSVIVAQDSVHVALAAATAAQAEDAEVALATAADQQRRLQKQAAGAAAQVKDKLAASQRLLAAASVQIQQLVAAEQAAEQRAANELAALIRTEQQRTKTLGVGLDSSIPLSPFVQQVLAAAEAELGKPYQWGATGPGSYDCSGLTQHAFAAAAVALPRTSRQQWFAGGHVTLAQSLPGDLLFWGSNLADPQSIHHVAIYLGGGYMLAAPHTGSTVRVEQVYTDGFFGVTRIADPTAARLPAAG